ncbi:MAG: TetR/AcrR family transcriptional regulator [Rectinemataceae bacterium]
MSRSRDPAKRETILREAKRLFARDGYDAASMGTLARAAGLPVGSLYTYFSGKEAIIEAIVEEGWGEFIFGLEAGLAAEHGLEARIDYLVYQALPGLFVDVDLITILLSEAGRSARLGEKLDRLASLVAGIFAANSGAANSGAAPDAQVLPEAKDIRMGLAIFLLGTLETVRLASRTALNLPRDELIDFVGRIAFSAVGLRQTEARRDFPTSVSS